MLLQRGKRDSIAFRIGTAGLSKRTPESFQSNSVTLTMLIPLAIIVQCLRKSYGDRLNIRQGENMKIESYFFYGIWKNNVL